MVAGLSVTGVSERERLTRRGQLAVSLLTAPSLRAEQPARSRWVRLAGRKERLTSLTKGTFLMFRTDSREFLTSSALNILLHLDRSS